MSNNTRHHQDELYAIENKIAEQLDILALVKLDKQTRQQADLVRAQLLTWQRSDYQNPDLWHAVLNLQTLLLSRLVEQKPAQKNGLLERLFAAKPEAETANAQPQQPTTPTTTSQDSGIKQKLQACLSSLLEQMSVAPEQATLKQSLQGLVASGVSIDQLPKLLQDITLLVSSSKIQHQRESESFLTSLHDRLQEVQQFLTSTQADEERSAQNRNTLSSSMQEELAGLRENAVNQTSIEQLRYDIEGMVSRITTTIDSFQSSEESRRNQVTERLETLTNRMQVIESEASALKADLEAQRKQALNDALTGLPNRAAYDNRILSEHSRWKRHGGSLSLAVIDIDHFKTINDNLGHLRGDKVLKIVAKQTANGLRKEDFVARFGGEEFIVVLPETDLPSAQDVMERIRLTIAQSQFSFNNQPVTVTVSIGVTSFALEDTIESCFERADQALYQAKKQGRNQTSTATSPANL